MTVTSKVTSPPTWRAAWESALYGTDGFSMRGGRGPRHDFSTSVTRGPGLAAALARLVERLNPPGDYDVVDMGAGDGSLLRDLLRALPPELASRARCTAVDLAPRPATLAAHIAWQTHAPDAVDGLLIAHEYLDTVPCDIVEQTAGGGPRLVMSDGTLGPRADTEEVAWLSDWWQLAEPGQRADLGLTRDAAWRALTARLTGGFAIAVDYGHRKSDRPAGSTLRAWSRGRPTLPTPDGDCDITAHVAIDACAEPGDWILPQNEALRRLGRNPRAIPTEDPHERLLALAETSRRRDLSDPDGLGGYLWLVHAAGGTDARAVFSEREDGL